MSEINLMIPFSEWEKGQWPCPWTSAMGLVPEIAKLGDNAVVKIPFAFEYLPVIAKQIGRAHV